MEHSLCKTYGNLKSQAVSGLSAGLENSDDARLLAEFYVGRAMPPYSERVYSCFGTPVQVRVPEVGDPSIQVTSTNFAEIRFVFRKLEQIMKVPESEGVDGWIEEAMRQASSDYLVGEREQDL